MTNHTPTPWSQSINSLKIKSKIDGVTVARADSATDAAHIVECVNRYDELVMLITELTNNLEEEIEARRWWELPRRIECDLGIVKQARIVLAEIEDYSNNQPENENGK